MIRDFGPKEKRIDITEYLAELQEADEMSALFFAYSNVWIYVDVSKVYAGFMDDSPVLVWVKKGVTHIFGKALTLGVCILTHYVGDHNDFH